MAGQKMCMDDWPIILYILRSTHHPQRLLNLSNILGLSKLYL